MIFDFWLPFVSRVILGKQEYEDFMSDLKVDDPKARFESLLYYTAQRSKLILPLGLCPKCMTPWISFFTFYLIISVFEIHINLWIFLFFYVTLTLLFVRAIIRYL